MKYKQESGLFDKSGDKLRKIETGSTIAKTSLWYHRINTNIKYSLEGKRRGSDERRHESGIWEDCPAYKLFEAAEVKKKDKILYPRKYKDTEVVIHEDQILDTVEVIGKM